MLNIFYRIKPAKVYYRMWKKVLYGIFVFVMLGRGLLADAITFTNPVGASNFPDLLNRIIDGLLPLSLLAATVGIMIAGFKFVTASLSGDTKKIGEAKQWLWWTIIGAAVIVGAQTLATIAVNFARGL